MPFALRQPYALPNDLPDGAQGRVTLDSLRLFPRSFWPGGAIGVPIDDDEDFWLKEWTLGAAQKASKEWIRVHVREQRRSRSAKQCFILAVFDKANEINVAEQAQSYECRRKTVHEFRRTNDIVLDFAFSMAIAALPEERRTDLEELRAEVEKFAKGAFDTCYHKGLDGGSTLPLEHRYPLDKTVLGGTYHYRKWSPGVEIAYFGDEIVYFGD